MKEHTKILALKDIKLDMSIYPRTSVNWQTALMYQDAMTNGAKFPPIRVAWLENEYKIIDGGHRVMAYKKNNVKNISVIIEPITNMKDAYIAALKYNIGHGKQLGVYERMLAVQKLKYFKIPLNEIAKLVHIRPTNIQKFIAKSLAYTTTGKEVILKKPVRNFAGMEVTTEQILGQNLYGGDTQASLLDELISIFENKSFNIKFVPKLQKLNALMQKYLKS